MAIKDLLWACPACHRVESIAADGRCSACGTRYLRGTGARIRAVTPDSVKEQTALEWLAQLPWPDLDGDGRSLPAGLAPPFAQRVLARLATGAEALRRGTDCLGFIESFAPSAPGRLELTDTHVTFMPDQGAGWSWELTGITAISPSSSALQLKARGHPVAQLRFTDGSLRLWEQRLQYCVRHAYVRAGQGVITEFQPRIRTR